MLLVELAAHTYCIFDQRRRDRDTGGGARSSNPFPPPPNTKHQAPARTIASTCVRFSNVVSSRIHARIATESDPPPPSPTTSFGLAPPIYVACMYSTGVRAGHVSAAVRTSVRGRGCELRAASSPPRPSLSTPPPPRCVRPNEDVLPPPGSYPVTGQTFPTALHPTFLVWVGGGGAGGARLVAGDAFFHLACLSTLARDYTSAADRKIGCLSLSRARVATRRPCGFSPSRCRPT